MTTCLCCWGETRKLPIGVVKAIAGLPNLIRMGRVWGPDAPEIGLPATLHRLYFSINESAAKSIYLFLSPEKDIAAFCFILMKTRKPIETIESIGVPLFSMLS